MISVKTLIIKRLYEAQAPLAVHELGIIGVSENGAATRLSELAGKGVVVGTIRAGAKFKEWRLAPAQGVLPL